MATKFEKDMQVGKIGETKARAFLEQMPNVGEIIDCSGDEYFQNKDIDYLVQVGERVVKCEVKTDTMAHKTGNLAFEVTTSGNPGCLEKTEADYIIYYLTENDIMLGFKMPKMRLYIERNKNRLRLIRMGDYATGYLIPIRELLRRGVVQRIA